MAAPLVGGAFLSASVQTLIEKVTSKEFRDYIRNTKLNISLLEQLKTTLLALQAVLDDAEEKQITHATVKKWLDDLKDAIFDAEDLLDRISTDSLRCKVESTQPQNVTNQVWNILSSPFKSFYREINSEMKKMCHRLQTFAEQRYILGLQIVSGRVSRRAPTTSLVNESLMVGRKDEKEKLINMLLSDGATSNKNTGVVSILGMGGVGKTTLAKLLYNDKEVQQYFHLKAWACISDVFDIVRVTKTLLESVSSKTTDSNNLDFLQVELKRNLRDKRFLFVLDDLWNENYNDWVCLLTPLIDGKIGSKVIITTRLEEVAKITHTFPIHKLEPLSDKDCWSLISKHAFGCDDFNSNYPNLEAIGKKIAKKCGGLPIAATTLGGLMHSNIDEKEWTKILNSNIWELRNDDTLPALRLSYQYLPSHLKRCFAYCSIFPKDYLIYRKQLVLLWMAEGFVQQSHGEKAPEEIGDDYFAELLSRSLIQRSNDDINTEKFVMHDLLNDLAVVVFAKTCYRLEYGDDISENVRHLSYSKERYDIYKKFEILNKSKCLRSFLPTGWQYCYLSKKVVEDLIPSLNWLRVLSLSGYTNVTMLPDSVGSLVQLRYMDLSHTGIKSLPDTTYNLYNLQTLILSRCKDLTELPMQIGKLVNLRHFDVSETHIKELPMQIEKLVNLYHFDVRGTRIMELPMQIGKLINLHHLDISGTLIKELPMQIVELENLQTLTVFAVGKQQVGLSALGKFPHLKGNLSILNLHNVTDATDAYDANLKSKQQIEELVLKWGGPADDSRIVNAVLDGLQPSINVEVLKICNFGGTSFPCWLGNSSFAKIVFLDITDCINCISLPPLGQLPFLMKLTIKGMTSLETIGPEFYGMAVGGSISSFQPFPSLESLIFHDMPNWKEWKTFESGEFPFPHLKTMSFKKCPELKGQLPNHLPSIEEIWIDECDLLLATLPTLHCLLSIKSITIGQSTQCSFPDSDSLCLLQDIRVEYCRNLLSLPKMILSSTFLRQLQLWNIPSLTSFPADGLPTSLRSLHIYYCGNLSFLPCETLCNYTSLVELEILNSCDSLTSFPLDGFPSIQRLFFQECRSLESIFIFEISSLLPASLQSLQINFCEALRSLPQRMDTLTALEYLTLCYDPELELSFCEGTFQPRNLRSMYIDSVRLPPKGVIEWGLQRLTALSDLGIGGDDIVNALLKGRLLPVSLVSLRIYYLSEMKSLEGNEFQHLTSLESLEFWWCPMLESLPEDRFPSSLKILEITGCPLLNARYESQRGEHWPKIAHIPILKINGEVTI